jgi:hypothetical protein
MAEIPAVLAGINAHTFLAQGTFRPIADWGNIKAMVATASPPGTICSSLLPAEQREVAKLRAAQLLECLSSVELETLLARIFEVLGCFVPAYRGGVVRDVDLIARPGIGSRLPKFGFPADKAISIQVKRWAELPESPGFADCFFCLPKPEGTSPANPPPWLITPERVLDMVQQLPSTRAWLRLSLAWFHNAFPDLSSHYAPMR